MKTIYKISYIKGNYEDAYEYSIFATESKEKAEIYKAKFNRLLCKWQEYINDYLETSTIYTSREEKFYEILEYSKCIIEEIEIR